MTKSDARWCLESNLHFAFPYHLIALPCIVYLCSSLRPYLLWLYTELAIRRRQCKEGGFRVVYIPVSQQFQKRIAAQNDK